MDIPPPYDGEALPRPRRRSSLADAPTATPKPRPPADGSGNLEPDTCRICRGEATPQEPLFYPCKCSGSIKYVHQDCLMEWLSHSQKKHCELCKTSFRFTKLYSPTMPKKLPVFVFLRHMTKYIIRNILVWFRIGLVVSVWLGWLPYLTRWEWSFFFWISEEGLVSPNRIFDQDASLLNATSLAAATSALSSSVCPSSPLFSAMSPSSATTAAAAAVSNGVNGRLGSNSAYAVNATTGEPLYSILVRLVADFIASGDGSSNNSSSSDAITAMGGPPTLLGEVSVLRNFTRYPAINKAIIYTLEGQIITILVIVCFILVILVRDYVVQQQPEIIMRQAFAAQAEDGLAAAQAAGELRPNQPVDGLVDESDWETDSQSDPEESGGEPWHHVDHGHDRWGDGGRDNVRRRRRDRRPDAELAAAPERVHVDEHAHEHEQEDEHEHGSEPLPIFQAEDMPFGLRGNTHADGHSASPSISDTRASSPTLESSIQGHYDQDHDDHHGEPGGIRGYNADDSVHQVDGPSSALIGGQRAAESNPGEGATVQEYMRIFREASGDPEKIRKIAKDEGLEDRLQYWLRLTQQVDKKEKESEKASSEAGQPGDDAESSSSDNARPALVNRAGQRDWHEMEESSSAESDDSDDSSRREQDNEPPSRYKTGKGKAKEENEEDEAQDSEGNQSSDDQLEDLAAEFGGGEIGSVLRRRANTDGPRRPEGLNPLANNNWSFPESRQVDAATSTSRDVPSDQALNHKDAADVSGMWNDLSSQSARLPAGAPLLGTQLPSSSDVSLNTPDSDEDNDSSQANANGNSRERQRPAADLDEMVPLRPAPRPPTNERESPADRDANNNGEVRDTPAVETGETNNVVAADVPTAAEVPVRRERPIGIFGRVANFMWQDLDHIDPAELPPINAEPFFEIEDGPFDDPEPRPDMAVEFEQDREVMEAAAAAGLDAEAIDDAEDLEGVMELLGMRGPIVALFQNAIFCAFLVTVTLLLGIFVPYNIGRVAVWLIANPMRPVMMLFSLSKLLQDLAAVLLGGLAFSVFYTLHLVVSAWEWMAGWGAGDGHLSATLFAAWNMSADAAMRIVESFLQEPPVILPGDIRNFSAISHEALVSLKGHVGSAFAAVGQGIMLLTSGDLAAKSVEAATIAGDAALVVWGILKAAPAVLSHPGSWVITLDSMDPVVVNPAFAYWDSVDRTLAILLGYSTLCLAAGLYLHRNTPFSESPTGREWEASLIDGLNQASGVMKVILIIGIEMLVFPLYCGLLLDVALLPLFENTTLKSRLLFTINYPLTSIFVHWFVGTGYMFHFALFVSMCRKIMRKGVLYFIRDPDDPEFHPVRDVLERNVTTQLRKILFSAFVYGALVIVCLGGVVWGLALAAPSILPIHYSSNEPVLEFPIDLLFYNFLMPLAIKFFKPSDGLHAMYTWWFRKSARILRITWFLFGERKVDEEGELRLRAKSPNWQLPYYRRMFLEYRDGEVAPKRWQDLFEFEFGTAKPKLYISRTEMIEAYADKHHLVHSHQLIPDGHFFRAPASDQVKIPKGRTVFLPVNDGNVREDDAMNMAEGHGRMPDVYATEKYQLVYIPPHFRTRIFLFILFIWLFAAVTGVSFTIIPLLFGRRLFQLLIPSYIRTNDIYAFSIGIYVLGSALYVACRARTLLAKASDMSRRVMSSMTSAQAAVFKAAGVVFKGCKLAYAYFFILLVFPLLATILVELYVLIPMHTYMYPGGLAVPTEKSGDAPAVDDSRHTIRIIQSWTLGLLYIKLGARTVTAWYPDTRMASAIRAILRHGRMDPDVHLLTRAFVVPSIVVGLVTILLPPLLAATFVASSSVDGAPSLDAYQLSLVYRLSYPFVALNAAMAWMCCGLVDVFGSWKVRIRDEAYLIGERLHNFGATNNGAGTRRAWRGGGHAGHRI